MCLSRAGGASQGKGGVKPSGLDQDLLLEGCGKKTQLGTKSQCFLWDGRWHQQHQRPQ